MIHAFFLSIKQYIKGLLCKAKDVLIAFTFFLSFPHPTMLWIMAGRGLPPHFSSWRSVASELLPHQRPRFLTRPFMYVGHVPDVFLWSGSSSNLCHCPAGMAKKWVFLSRPLAFLGRCQYLKRPRC